MIVKSWDKTTMHQVIDSPLGRIVVLWDEASFPKATAILLPSSEQKKALKATRPGANPPPVARKITDYLAGKKVRFSLADLDLSQLSTFRAAVSKACFAVPRGTTVSYGELAAAAGNPKGSRAVGGVMAANPFPIAIPCHRVVAADGRLHNFGGGLPLKAGLLELEGLTIAPGYRLPTSC
jgi:methylated-DNA-[protein]-cysteine S-methyltransferase